ncbi:MAG: hypothetical protein GX245_03615 [Eubacteriaceae bacterium]|jgi:hypothetical protein|nr:hypothetical protein [Eubacteriaceae bacterium]
MKKRGLYIIIIIFLIGLLTACGSTKVSESYKDLIGSWLLDSRYVDTVPQKTAMIILDFKSDETVDIYEYIPTEEQPATVFRADAAVPDKSTFTLKETSPVAVKGNAISYQYQGNTIEATFSVDLNSMSVHMYIQNEEGRIIHDIYKTADKEKRP